MIKKSTAALFVLIAIALTAFAIDPSYGGWATQPHTRFTRQVPDGWLLNQGAVTANLKGTNLGPDAGPAYLFSIQESDEDLQFIGRIAVVKGRKMLFSIQSDTDPISYSNVVMGLSSEGLELYGEDGTEGELKIVAGHLVFENSAGQQTVIAQ